MTLGEKIQKLRKARGLSQEQLAEHLNISRQAISRWEQNAASPEVENLLALSHLFGVTTDYLLQESIPLQDNVTIGYDVQVSEKIFKQRLSLVMGFISSVLGCLGLISLFIFATFEKKNMIIGARKANIFDIINIYGLEWLVIVLLMLMICGIAFIISRWNPSKTTK